MMEALEEYQFGVNATTMVAYRQPIVQLHLIPHMAMSDFGGLNALEDLEAHCNDDEFTQ
ncbi:8547_t:CDS:2 [Entrophospora sp. SA101]|nr:8547_t:CDS:2 [Entrophospora sp. SA101]